MTIALYKRIATWISNNTEAADPRLPASTRAKWTARLVFNDADENQDAITTLQHKIMRKEGKPPLAALNMARSQLFKKLTREEKAVYADQAQVWTDAGPPPEDLVRYVQCPVQK